MKKTESLHDCLTALLCFENLLKLIKPPLYLSSPFISIWVICNQGTGLKRARQQITLSTRPSMWASRHSISTTWESRRWSRRRAKRPLTPFCQTIKSGSQVVKLRNKTKNSSFFLVSIFKSKPKVVDPCDVVCVQD